MRPVLAGPICRPGECDELVAVIIAGFAVVLAFAVATAKAATYAVSAWCRARGRSTALAGPAGALAFVVAIVAASRSTTAVLALIAADVVLVVAGRRARPPRPPDDATTADAPAHDHRDGRGARPWYR